MQKPKSLKLIVQVFYILFAISILIAFFIPVYSDEIAVKMTSPNLLKSGFEHFMLFPQCGQSYIKEIPWTWYPGSLLDWILNGTVTNPFHIRVIGVANFLIWLLWIRTYLQTNIQKQNNINLVLTSFIALCSLGIIPFLMVLNRGEQSLLLGLTFACLLPPLLKKISIKPLLISSVVVIFFIIFTSFTYLTHPKALFYTPVFIISALYIGISNRIHILSAFLSCFSIFLSYQSFQFWNSRFLSCEAPVIKSLFEAQSLLISNLLSSPWKFLEVGLENSINSYIYFKNILFKLHYQANWLPSSTEIKLDFFSIFNDALIILTFIFILVLVIFKITQFAWYDFQKRIFSYDICIVIALFVGNFACAFFRSTKNFYDSSLALPVFFLIALLLFTRHVNQELTSKKTNQLFLILLTIAIFSLCNLILTFYPFSLSNWISEGRVQGQAESISINNYWKVQSEIKSSASVCGIESKNNNLHLAIDYETYFPFKNSKKIYLIPTILMDVKDKDTKGKYLLSFLFKNDSAGLISRCDSLPEDLIQRSKKEGLYCCMSYEDIKNNLFE